MCLQVVSLLNFGKKKLMQIFLIYKKKIPLKNLSHNMILISGIPMTILDAQMHVFRQIGVVKQFKSVSLPGSFLYFAEIGHETLPVMRAYISHRDRDRVLKVRLQQINIEEWTRMTTLEHEFGMTFSEFDK